MSDEFDWVTTTDSFGIPCIIAPLNRDSLYFVLLICRNKNWVSHLRGKTDRIFESRVQRRIFGWNRNKVAGYRPKMHNEGRSGSTSQNIRRMRSVEHVARMGRRDFHEI